MRLHARELVPGLDQGGWHDAGDYDLRVESQAGTVWLLAMMIEEFGLDYDATMIDFENHLVEIHQPDGNPMQFSKLNTDWPPFLVDTVPGKTLQGYHLPRSTAICDVGRCRFHDRQQFLENEDDRWVFTEINPRRELQVVQGLAALQGSQRCQSRSLSKEALETAIALWESACPTIHRLSSQKVHALTELILTTGDPELIQQPWWR